MHKLPKNQGQAALFSELSLFIGWFWVLQWFLLEPSLHTQPTADFPKNWLLPSLDLAIALVKRCAA